MWTTPKLSKHRPPTLLTHFKKRELATLQKNYMQKEALLCKTAS
jgi:hypothetical protein